MISLKMNFTLVMVKYWIILYTAKFNEQKFHSAWNKPNRGFYRFWNVGSDIICDYNGNWAYTKFAIKVRDTEFSPSSIGWSIIRSRIAEVPEIEF